MPESPSVFRELRAANFFRRCSRLVRRYEFHKRYAVSGPFIWEQHNNAKSETVDS